MVDLLNEVFGTNLIVSADPDTVQEQGEDDASDEDNNSTSFMDDAAARETNNADEDSDNGADCRGGASVNPADPKKPGPHRAQRLADCRDFLIEWHYKCWKKDHSNHLWGPPIILPDHLITKFASSAWVKSIEDVHHEFDGWMWIDEYSGEVLEGLDAIDRKYEEVRQAKEAAKQQQKAEQRAERERKVAETRLQAAERKEQAKKRKAEERVRKQEEKKRQRRIATEEKRRLEIEEAEAERQLWEVERRQRTSYDTHLNLPPQVQNLPPPPPQCPRPRPTKRIPPAQGQGNPTTPQLGPFQSSMLIPSGVIPHYPAQGNFMPPMYPSPPAVGPPNASLPAIQPMPYALYENSRPWQSELSPTPVSHSDYHNLTQHSRESFLFSRRSPLALIPRQHHCCCNLLMTQLPSGTTNFT